MRTREQTSAVMQSIQGCILKVGVHSFKEGIAKKSATVRVLYLYPYTHALEQFCLVPIYPCLRAAVATTFDELTRKSIMFLSFKGCCHIFLF